MISLATIKLYSFTVTSSILLVMYAATLIRVLKGSKFSFVIKMIILLMLYNIGVLAHQWLLKLLQIMFTHYTFRNDVLIGVLAAEGIAIIVEFGCYNVAHWMFAF